MAAKRGKPAVCAWLSLLGPSVAKQQCSDLVAVCTGCHSKAAVSRVPALAVVLAAMKGWALLPTVSWQVL
jgi:hypothetical protein